MTYASGHKNLDNRLRELLGAQRDNQGAHYRRCSNLAELSRRLEPFFQQAGGQAVKGPIAQKSI
jgi:hypothetical protein